jgi:uncharacterized protein YneF (UPF0154 family)
MYDARYWREFSVWSVAYLIMVSAAVIITKSLPEGSAWRLVVMVPVVAAMLGGAWIELRLLRRVDEMQRSIYLEGTLVSMWLTMLVTGTGWLFEALAGMPRLSPAWTMAALGVGFFLGYFNARRRYR